MDRSGQQRAELPGGGSALLSVYTQLVSYLHFTHIVAEVLIVSTVLHKCTFVVKIYLSSYKVIQISWFTDFSFD